MTPEFARAVDPVFLYVIDLMERIGADQSVDIKEERVKIRSRLDQAEALVGQGPEWSLTRYALVTWIDELLIEAPWNGAEWWKNNTLEWEDFKSADAYEAFYLKAREASALRKKDALEVFYICAVLGFRGLYREGAKAAALVEPLELPPDLETWARQTAMAIQLQRGRPPISSESVPIEGAAPLDGPFVLLWAALVALVLGVSCGVVGFFVFFSPH